VSARRENELKIIGFIDMEAYPKCRLPKSMNILRYNALEETSMGA